MDVQTARKKLELIEKDLEQTLAPGAREKAEEARMALLAFIVDATVSASSSRRHTRVV